MSQNAEYNLVQNSEQQIEVRTKFQIISGLYVKQSLWADSAAHA